jgi:hypothetical protein
VCCIIKCPFTSTSTTGQKESVPYDASALYMKIIMTEVSPTMYSTMYLGIYVCHCAGRSAFRTIRVLVKSKAVMTVPLIIVPHPVRK